MQKRIDPFSIKLSNTEIKYENMVKFMGVLFNDCLSFWKRRDCGRESAILNSINYEIHKLKYILKINDLLRLNYAQVDPRLPYSICLWGNFSLSYDVFEAQRQILTTIVRYGSYRHLHICLQKLWDTDSHESLYFDIPRSCRH